MDAPTLAEATILILLYLDLVTLSRPDNMLRFSTKTAYRTLKPETLGDLTGRFRVPENYKPVQINALLRHGSRTPKKELVDKIRVTVSKIRGSVRSQRLNRFNTLDSELFHIDRDDQYMHLHKEGMAEHYGIGSRVGAAFRDLFSDRVSNDVLVVASHKRRARDSAKHFMRGFDQSLAGVGFNTKHSVDDDLLRFFDTCDHYINHVERNNTAVREYHAFLHGPEMDRVAGKVSARLELETTLNAGDAFMLFQLCAFDYGLYNRSDWCILLDREDFDVLEYAADLKQYWLKSYGHEVNYRQSCPVLTDFVSYMDAAVRSKEASGSYPQAVLRFGHAETLIPFLTQFGLYNDTVKLTSTNFSEMKDRRFRSSLFSPMAGNALIVLYRDTKTDRFYVHLFVNERLEQLPHCDEILCSYDQFRKSYVTELGECKFKKICKLPGHDEL